MFSRSIARRAASAAGSRSFVRQSALAMPLRAKMLPRGQQQQQPPSAAQMSSQAAPPKSPKHDRFVDEDPEDIFVNTLYGLRSIELHRPSKFNALSLNMIRKIDARLREWSKSDMANVIVMKGAGDKAFCAGGDVAKLVENNRAGNAAASIDYFRREYQLDYRIATLAKPYVALMDGITMGGGVGLSMHAPFRIATERTVFAMPETAIGFFPDVGASYVLPRLAGETGTYLALTSDALRGPAVYHAGLASHYLHSTSLPALESRLAELRFADHDPLPARLAAVNATIDEFATGLPPNEPIHLGGALRAAIDDAFGHDSVDDIVASLKRLGTAAADPAIQSWAERTLATLQERSPTSLHVTLKLLRLGRGWDLATAFKREYYLAAQFMRRGGDFNEGVAAKLIDKPKRTPAWDPPTLADVRSGDDVADQWLGAFDPSLPPLAVADADVLDGRADAEHRWRMVHQFSLPDEATIAQAVADANLRPAQVVDKVMGGGVKQGVREVVEEVLKRKTRLDAQGFVRWVY